MTRNVLVTGATGAIGFAIAKKFKDNGFNVFVTGRSCEKMARLDNMFDGYFCCNLSDDNACCAHFDEAKKQLGQIDILVNNAGEYLWAEIENTADEQISSMIKINFEVPYRLSKIFVKQMQENYWGRIINIGSISGAVGEANATLYSATKSALIGLTKSLALEKADKNITVNIINPGWVDTELTRDALSEDAFTVEETLDMIPQRRFITPEEIADCALYLASDAARGITGQYINLCAGLSIG